MDQENRSKTDKQVPDAPQQEAKVDAVKWCSRGYLPHFESTHLVQHVTFHLADSLPAEVQQRFEQELRVVPQDKKEIQRREKMETWLDAGHGCCVLRDPVVASLVQKALLFFDGQRYRMLAWVVMPNHVHTLFQPIEGWTVAKIVASWKSYTGKHLPKSMPDPAETPRTQRLWHREYWDRYIRNDHHLQVVKNYIHNNPVKAGLVQQPHHWEWSSAKVEWEKQNKAGER